MGKFVLKNIEMTLDPESIQNAIDEINDLTYDLQRAMDALCEYLLKQGVQIARFKLRGYLTRRQSNRGNLMKSIRYEMANGKSGEGYLIAGYPGDTMYDGANSDISYAVFFEFGYGTGSYYYRQSEGGGLIKSQSSVDRRISAGAYDPSRTSGRTKSHPSGRGHYKSADDSKIMNTPNKGEFFGWVYKDRWTGKFYVSQGQPPKPFMYETLLEMRSTVDKEAERFIAEYIP